MPGDFPAPIEEGLEIIHPSPYCLSIMANGINNLCQGGPAAPWLMPADEIADLIKATGMSGAALSRYLGVNRMTVSNWRHGKTPAPKMAILLMKILAAKRQALITGQKTRID